MCRNCEKPVQTTVRNLRNNRGNKLCEMWKISSLFFELRKNYRSYSHFNALITQTFAHIFSPISHLLIGYFSAVSTTPITITTNLYNNKEQA